MKQNRRGRPTGFKMTAESKEQIRQTKLGTTRSEVTKARISAGVRKRNTGVPIDILMNTDLTACHKVLNNRYMNVFIPNPVFGLDGWSMRLHVAIIEQHLGRKLLPGEDTHHIDENKLNNDINNLVVLKHQSHCRLHRIMKQAVRLN
jgi:hypothetical protein